MSSASVRRNRARETPGTPLPRGEPVETPAGRDPGHYGLRSNAPSSHFRPWGRAVPRWSFLTTAWQAAFAILLRAGLPTRSAIVFVGPPFAASAPSLGAGFVWSDATWVMEQSESSPNRLNPSEAPTPRQSGEIAAVL